MEQEIVLTHSAVLARVDAFGAARGAFSADCVLGKGDPYLSSSDRALSDALFLSLEHFEIRLALCANRGIERIARSARLMTDLASSCLAFGRNGCKVGHRDFDWA